ncbi:hypothetical protein [Parapedobacter sp. DT-150]|uniref:hypothetical protein n=1 Tax=Parapedobacter sp. DT-150 TaxID=3396162 RepID=UPI003F1A19F3
MLNRLIAILLVCSLFTESISRLLVTAAFELNQRYISEYFCVNKDKPMLHCDGHCYLARKLKEAEDNEKKSEKESHHVNYQPAYITETSVWIFPEPSIVTHHSAELPFDLPTQLVEIFHPPRA